MVDACMAQCDPRGLGRRYGEVRLDEYPALKLDEVTQLGRGVVALRYRLGSVQ